ncbi:MAG: O-antigen ligase family protein [Cytophagales bacterium]|nr:O-antigen ligase family protein [Cytophagales bacterium]
MVFTRKNIIILSTFGIIVGLFTRHIVRILPSVSLIVFLCLALSRKDFLTQLKAFFSFKNIHLWIAMFFVLHLPYFFTTDAINMKHYLKVLQLRTPLVGLGLSFFFAPTFSRKHYHYLIYTFFICSFVTAFGSLSNYVINFDEVSTLLNQGKPLPVVVNHVRYSLMLCFAIFCGIFLYYHKISFSGKKWENYLQLGAVLFLILFIHISGVRSGLLSFYSTVGLGTIYFMIRQKKYILGIGIIATLLFTPLIAYKTLPSVQQKVETTLVDLNSLENEYNANFQSLHNRIVSYKVGWRVFKENPILGTGVGNFKRACLTVYARQFSFIHLNKRLHPHNQFLYVAGSMGIVGLLLFCILFYAPLWKFKLYKHSLILIFYFIMTISFLSEATLSTQLGTTFCMVFVSMFSEMSRKEEE